MDVQKHYYLIMSFLFLGGVPLILLASMTFQWIKNKMEGK